MTLPRGSIVPRILLTAAVLAMTFPSVAEAGAPVRVDRGAYAVGPLALHVWVFPAGTKAYSVLISSYGRPNTCETIVRVPKSSFFIAGNLSRAALNTDTPCGYISIVWRASSLVEKSILGDGEVTVVGVGRPAFTDSQLYPFGGSLFLGAFVPM